MKLFYLLYIGLICIIIYLFIQYAFTINEQFTNKMDTSSSVTFNKLDEKDITYINSYVPDNSTECLNIKCGLNMDTHETNYTKYYLSNQVPFTSKETEKIKELIQNVMKHPKFTDKTQSPYSLFVNKYKNNMKWNLLKTRNLEVNLPCTLSKCILLPEELLRSENWKNVQEILIHEQIHILQRQSQYEFNELYKT